MSLYFKKVKNKERHFKHFTETQLVIRIDDLQAALLGFSLILYRHHDPNHFSYALDILKKGPTVLVSELYRQI